MGKISKSTLNKVLLRTQGCQFAHNYERNLWRRELGSGHYVSIWLFENIMQMALGQFPSQCGMLGRCAPQFVVEADGSVYPCDFYALDEHRVGDIRTDELEAMATCETMRAFLDEPRRACSQCASCPFEGICHRNCKRLNIAYYDEGYCGLREFLEYAYPGLQRAVRMLARRQPAPPRPDRMEASMTNRPNVLLIMCDQMRGDCLGIDGHPDVRTPYLDTPAVNLAHPRR